MAALDLGDYVDDLKAEVNPPGSNFYPLSTDDNWLQQLRDAFWEARLDGFLAAYTETDGLVTPLQATDPTFTRDLVQLVVFYAGFRVLRASLRNLQTMTRSKAGPVEFETQQSATVARELLKELQEKRAILLRRLSDLGIIPVGYIDGIAARSDAQLNGEIYWTAGRVWTNQFGYLG